MKKAKLFPAVVLLAVMTGCGGGNKQTADELITVDVNASYPEKELVLQDFMDVEYVPLETTDEFITQGVVDAIGKDILLVTNRKNDGDIFVFDRATGKGLRKINRLGQSGEEYTQLTGIILDEDNNEMFVTDFPARKILVYDLYGNFKRSFPFADTSYYAYIFNYDRDHLICYKSYLPLLENEQSCHVLVSKKDGSITKEIQIPFSGVETPVAAKGEMTVTPGFDHIVPYRDSRALTRASSDTLYYLADGGMSPYIVRTPSIHSMDPQVFLFPTVVTDDYYFMQALTKKFDFEKMKGFLTNGLVYDKKNKAIFEYTVYNGDFTEKRQVSFGSKTGNAANEQVATIEVLNASDLVEAYGKGQLKGKLKDIAAKLDEESNPVVMLIKHKE
ncbi:6-bladed beta-propeller [Bacteroides sp.]